MLIICAAHNAMHPAVANAGCGLQDQAQVEQRQQQLCLVCEPSPFGNCSALNPQICAADLLFICKSQATLTTSGRMQAQRFPEVAQSITDAIAELGGAVVPKLNWSCPQAGEGKTTSVISPPMQQHFLLPALGLATVCLTHWDLLRLLSFILCACRMRLGSQQPEA